MAIAKAFEPNDYSKDFTFNVKDTAIGGKLVSLSHVVDEFDSASFSTEDAFARHIKAVLANELVKFMMNEKLIEFTYQVDPNTNTKRFNARCYLSNDDTIKLLRTHYK